MFFETVKIFVHDGTGCRDNSEIKTKNHGNLSSTRCQRPGKALGMETIVYWYIGKGSGSTILKDQFWFSGIIRLSGLSGLNMLVLK